MSNGIHILATRSGAMKLLAFLNIILYLPAVLGLFGILGVYSGIRLWGAANHARQGNLDGALQGVASYFFLQAIILVIGMGLSLAMLAIGGIGFITSLGGLL